MKLGKVIKQGSLAENRKHPLSRSYCRLINCEAVKQKYRCCGFPRNYSFGLFRAVKETVKI